MCLNIKDVHRVYMCVCIYCIFLLFASIYILQSWALKIMRKAVKCNHHHICILRIGASFWNLPLRSHTHNVYIYLFVSDIVCGVAARRAAHSSYNAKVFSNLVVECTHNKVKNSTNVKTYKHTYAKTIYTRIYTK